MVLLKGKKLLILAGAGVHSKVVRAAKEMGIYTIVTDNIENSPAKLIADEAWMLSITDVEAIVAKCKESGVNGVVNFCIDPGQIPYQRICEALDLPCFGTKEQFGIMTNKARFKAFCTAHNVDVIPDYSLEEIENGDVEYPIFIKPTDSRGSRGQSICNNKEEVLSAIEYAKKESKDAGFMCEKYMGGHQDIGSAFWVIDGKPYLIKFADRHLGRIEDKMDKQVMCTMLPSDFNIESGVLSRVEKMIEALGIKFGPVFMQGFVDGDTIRYYDPAMRMPGGDYDLLLKEATGFDTCKTMIHFALTGDPTIAYGNPVNAYKLEGKVAMMFSLSVRPGKIEKVIGMDKVLEHPSVYYGRQIINEGEIVPDSGDVRQRAVAIGVILPDKAEISKFIDFLYSNYRINDENGENMIISQYYYKVG